MEWLILPLIPAGGWLIAAFMFRDNFGYYPWQGDDIRTARYCEGYDDPESRCPRKTKDCVC